MQEEHEITVCPIDDYEGYFSGRIMQIQDRFERGETTLDEAKTEFAVLEDDMLDELEDDVLTGAAYDALCAEIEEAKSACENCDDD